MSKVRHTEGNYFKTFRRIGLGYKDTLIPVTDINPRCKAFTKALKRFVNSQSLSACKNLDDVLEQYIFDKGKRLLEGNTYVRVGKYAVNVHAKELLDEGILTESDIERIMS